MAKPKSKPRTFIGRALARRRERRVGIAVPSAPEPVAVARKAAPVAAARRPVHLPAGARMLRPGELVTPRSIEPTTYGFDRSRNANTVVIDEANNYRVASYHIGKGDPWIKKMPAGVAEGSTVHMITDKNGEKHIATVINRPNGEVEAMVHPDSPVNVGVAVRGAPGSVELPPNARIVQRGRVVETRVDAAAGPERFQYADLTEGVDFRNIGIKGDRVHRLYIVPRG